MVVCGWWVVEGGVVTLTPRVRFTSATSTSVIFGWQCGVDKVSGPWRARALLCMTKEVHAGR